MIGIGTSNLKSMHLKWGNFYSHLWIAKFPSKNDHEDSGARELIVNQMAYELCINVATGKANTYSQKRHTFLSKRFDRTSDNKRIHFASAMSLLGYNDGYDHKEGGSYLELVELIKQYGSEANDDIRELWRRRGLTLIQNLPYFYAFNYYRISTHFLRISTFYLVFLSKNCDGS